MKVFKEKTQLTFIISKMLNNSNQLQFKEMNISRELAKKIAISQFYTYKNYEHLFCEILAYMSYEAKKIEFKIIDHENNKFLCIIGNDGGISKDNLEVLASEEIGKSTKQNISYFGAGARTAARQYTNDCSENIFAICDSKNEIIYSTEGLLGLSVVKSKNIIKKKLKLDIKKGYTWWILPYLKDNWDIQCDDNEKNTSIKEKFINHLFFMYNDRFTSKNKKLKLKLKWLKKFHTCDLSLFENTDAPDNPVKRFEILGKKYYIYEHMKDFKVRLVHIRKANKDGTANKSCSLGKSLVISKGEKKEKQSEYYHYHNSYLTDHNNGFVTDYNCVNFIKFGQENLYKYSFNEEFNFSYEFMDTGNGEGSKNRYEPNENPRRGKIIKKFFNDKASSVPGIRFLMENTKQNKICIRNFITKESMKGDNWINTSIGRKYRLMLYISLTKRQYEKYAKPSIKRSDQWECHPNLKDIAENLYNYLSKKYFGHFKKLKQMELKEKIKKEKEKKQQEKKEKQALIASYISYHKKNTSKKIILLIQKNWRRHKAKKIVKEIKEKIKKEEEERRRRKEEERRRLLEEQQQQQQQKEENISEYNKDMRQFERKMNDLSGYLYYRHTKQMREWGIKIYGNIIIKIGMIEKQEPKTRLKQHHRNDMPWLPLEEKEEEYKWMECYNIKKAEDDLKCRLNMAGKNLKDIGEGTICTNEHFVCDEKLIRETIDKVIKKQIEIYNDAKKTHQKHLMEKYSLEQNDIRPEESEQDSSESEQDSSESEQYSSESEEEEEEEGEEEEDI